ncbi:MAG: hypothetical protein DRQ48_01875 [Gammaproteobacteria bacterium]|nr:MAG: hypothetical protein DRQ48_01875 [Gammaproteobacteria bacterium]
MMKMLAVNTRPTESYPLWSWVARRCPKSKQLVVTPFKGHALGPEDLEYFRGEFPELEFRARVSLND